MNCSTWRRLRSTWSCRGRSAPSSARCSSPSSILAPRCCKRRSRAWLSQCAPRGVPGSTEAEGRQSGRGSACRSASSLHWAASSRAFPSGNLRAVAASLNSVSQVQSSVSVSTPIVTCSEAGWEDASAVGVAVGAAGTAGTSVEVRWYIPRGTKRTSPGASVTSSTRSESSASGAVSPLFHAGCSAAASAAAAQRAPSASGPRTAR